MELADGTVDIVHPEVRAHITSLVSALGGINPDDDGKYQLGDDALEVLRDLKRWIRFYDEKTNRMDVARCILEANLIEGDLLPILATWGENSTENKFRSRIALSCFELMVPLTWPIEKDRETMTINHHRHTPVLELAQIQYKRAIINFDGSRILHAAVRAALPAIAMPSGDRSTRDQGVIKLVLFFLRNIALINPAADMQFEGDESQVSRSATIDAFSYQDILMFLLTLSSNMGDDFRTEDTIVMEIIYHLVKQVDIERLFMDEQQLSKAKATELSSMMHKEDSMLKAYNRKGPTRHNRFGTMIWVQREDGKMSSLSGQDALADASVRNKKLDESKTYRPPKRQRKDNKDERDLGLPAPLTASARKQLRQFVEEFLDSGFNPLFSHVRRTIDREASHLMQQNRRQFFYLVAWFLEAERYRRKNAAANKQKPSEEVGSFNLVAGVLNQEMFITLNKALHDSYEFKDWAELAAVMRCFTQILQTVQEMSEQGTDDDKDIAENVLSRLFYEEATQDMVANIVRTYKDQSFEYLDAATELCHHFLRTLEQYSKQNAEMQIRSRRRARQKKKDQAAADDNGAANDDSGEDEPSVERISKERTFDFKRFAVKFTPQGAVDTFATFLKYYQELNSAQLKRAHRYFYRLAFKQDMVVMLFRVDLIRLFYTMIKGTDALDKSNAMFKDWEELVKQILRRCVKKIEERPETLVEMLFSKSSSTAFFLEYGFEKQTTTTKAQAKPATELVFKNTEERDRQIAIVIGAMIDKNQTDHIGWMKKIVADAESERRSWAAANDALADPFVEDDDGANAAEPKKSPLIYVQSDTAERKTAIFKNSHLRLLMTLCGCERDQIEESPETVWIIPSDITADHLKDSLHFISQAEFSPPTFEDGSSAEQQLKRKSAPRKKADFDDDNGDDMGDFLDDGIFAPGGPTARKAIDEDRPATKKTRRKRRGSQEIDDSVLEERAQKRREREREKASKIKSALFVKDGDDEFDSEEDEEFFARERAIKARAEAAAQSAHTNYMDIPTTAVATKKRKSMALTQETHDSESDENLDDRGDRESSGHKALSSQESADASETDNTPVEQSEDDSRKRRRLSPDEDDADVDADATMQDADDISKNAEEEDDEAPSTARRPRVRGGFVIDSDDDE